MAIVFADISGSTRLYDTLGDPVARQLIAQCLAVMRDVVTKHKGKVIKTIGDEIMCVFASAEAAVEASTGMQDVVTEDLPAMNPNAPTDLTIRVGLHFGAAIVEGGDVFGDAVNVAARMAGLAKGGQIITTQSTTEALTPILQAGTRHVDRIAVKGKAEQINIFEVIWQEEDVTRMATGLLATQTVRGKLRLKYRDKEVVLTSQQTRPFILGRGKMADMVVNDGMASREHTKIELRRGKFVLTDQSTNGTYVLTPEGTSYLRRDDLILTARGQICLGRDFKENPTEVVFFYCEEGTA
ncbi:MAG: adenylate/guanylate cyclase domain-containing protein [Gammaproteobacteria bacterium]|nr:adenylate/guanylate cyclase domain-containing protein [Gammaproteobacteria bacterium]